ncbi:haloacid dehalogenase type II [Paracidovorax konjaci]|nr:haloacid dehalogenase type II [Paracidovorax konjaci]
MEAFRDIRLVVFDVFGTVVDWHGSIVRELAALAPQVDGDAFALAWRAGYQPAMQRVRSGERGWVALDTLHREILDGLLPRFGLAYWDGAARDHLNRAWHRLQPWPDSVGGLQRLRQRFMVSPLSNGNLGLLANMAKAAGLPWDCILSAEVFRAYKPDPAVYRGAAEVFGLPPEAVLMAAAHHEDLEAARACGLRTAYIERPHEFGAVRPKDVSPRPGNHLHCATIGALADALGCPA